MRSFLRILWVALVLLVVALLSALITMRLAIHGREITVPDFQGKTPAEARRIADDNGLAVQVEREYYSPTVARGRVLSQMPAAGTVVRRGWELRLALSLGPQRVAIPQVIGESERVAAISIQERGLEAASTASVQLSGVPASQVIAQNPPPNATDVAAPKISLLVAQDSTPQAFVMPSFIGQPLGSASVPLTKAGFPPPRTSVALPAAVAPALAPAIPAVPDHPASTAASSVSSPPVGATPAIASPAVASPASIIITQTPAPGAKVLSGSVIAFVVKD